MDENQFYQTIGRLYAELLNSSQVIQNTNNVVGQLQARISELELEIQSISRPEASAPDPEPNEEIPVGYDPVPPRITTYESQQ